MVRDGKRIAALAQPTKMGHLFILDRDTGKPVLPVEERPVPQDAVAGEWLSPTQPFPVATPRLVPDRLEPKDAWGLTPWDRGKCRETLSSLRRSGIFTPPSLQGTLEYPGAVGGTNWGGLSFDRSRGLIVDESDQHSVHSPTDPARADHGPKEPIGGVESEWEYALMKGTPYVMRRKAVALAVGPAV